MKKILTIALIATLVVSTAFAGLSGKATLNLGYNTETGAYGFSNGSSYSLALDVATETAETTGEGDIYAGAKATVVLKAADITGENAAAFVYNGVTDIGLGFIFKLNEAYVAGTDWKVAITGTQNGPDFAKSAIDLVFDKYAYDDFGNQAEAWWNKTYKAKSYSVSVNKAPGATATYKDWKVALGFNGGKANSATGAPDFFNYHFSAFTPSFEIAEGMTIKAAAVASGIKNATKKDTAGKKVYNESVNYDAFGASIEGAYVSDAFSGKLSADFGMKKTVGTDKYVLGLDVAANTVISGFTVDAYYQYGEKKQWISAQIKGDLNEFDVPVVITVYGKNVADSDEGQTFGGEVSGTIEAFTVTAGGSYTLSSKELGLSGSVKYAAEKFTAKAGVDFSKTLVEDGAKQLYANASVESDSVIPGATLKLAYGPCQDGNTGNYTTNLLDKTYGKVDASCTIKF